MLVMKDWYKIKGIKLMLDEEGRVSTPDALPGEDYPYTEYEKLGKGGYGMVFRAKALKDGKDYVAKHEKLNKMDMFGLYEWQVLSRPHLQHNNIIRGFECFLDPVKLVSVTVMEYAKCK